jgi:hypothetical protein
MTILADTFLWVLAVASPAAGSAPFAFTARHRTPGKIAAAIWVSSAAAAVFACAAWRLM